MVLKEGIQNVVRIKNKDSRKGYLCLDMNENPAGLPEEFVKEVLDSITPEDLAKYPETEVLETLLSSELRVPAENLCIVNGTDEGIKSIFETYTIPGKEVVGVYPTFEMYPVYCSIYGLKYRGIEYNEELQMDSNQILNAITPQTALVVLLNPNNPIGSTFTEEEAEKIILKARENNAAVIVDEAYHYYYQNTFLSLARKYDNVILMRTFSKLCSIAGCRIGYLCASPEVIEMINRVRPSAGVNVFGIHFACAILRNKSLISRLISEEQEGKKVLYHGLEELGYEPFHGEGNFVLVKPRIHPEKLFFKLKEQNILIKTFRHPVLKDYIRITTGNPFIMEQFLEKLKMTDCNNLKC